MTGLTHDQSDRGRAATARARRKLAASGAVGASLLCGLLIWAKLRLVTDIPRTAYAAPESQSRAVSELPDSRTVGTLPEDEVRRDHAPD